MIKFEHTEVMGWEHAIRGMRNPMNSWEKSDSAECRDFHCSEIQCPFYSDEDGDCVDGIRAEDYIIGPNDFDLMKRLRNAGTDHRKFMRMITVYVDVTAPLYWWKEFDTYRVGVEKNSCSTMHKIAEKEFTLEDFSCEHLIDITDKEPYDTWLSVFRAVVSKLNHARELYIETKDKKYWWQMIQLLPSSYNQRRTVMMNYEVLANIYKSRKNHKLDEWSENHINVDGVDMSPGEGIFGFCDWIKTLPYSELITGPSLSDIPIANEIMEEAKRRVEE